MNLQNITLSEISPMRIEKSYDVTHMWNLKELSHGNRVEQCVSGTGWGLGWVAEILLKGHKISVRQKDRRNKFRRYTGQQHNYS